MCVRCWSSHDAGILGSVASCFLFIAMECSCLGLLLMSEAEVPSFHHGAVVWRLLDWVCFANLFFVFLFKTWSWWFGLWFLFSGPFVCPCFRLLGTWCLSLFGSLCCLHAATSFSVRQIWCNCTGFFPRSDVNVLGVFGQSSEKLDMVFRNWDLIKLFFKKNSQLST